MDCQIIQNNCFKFSGFKRTHVDNSTKLGKIVYEQNEKFKKEILGWPKSSFFFFCKMALAALCCL